MVKHAKGCCRVCKEVKSTSEALLEYPSTKKDPEPGFLPWPFTQWSLDIVRLFPRNTGNRRFFIVATDYFMKWVETEALANI